MLDKLFETELLKAALITPLEIISQTDDPKLDFVRIHCRIGADDVPSSAFALIYMLSFLSFRDARAAGYSENQFEGNDTWSAVDMFQNLEFVDGTLSFYADYIRGRRMKTTVIMTADGSLTIETSGRGSAALRWVSNVQGRKVFSVIQGGRA